jgi:hypothetical protein
VAAVIPVVVVAMFSNLILMRIISGKKMCLNKNAADGIQDGGPDSQSKLCKQVGCFVYMLGE